MADAAVVTGGTGFVGANLARKLLASGHDTHLLVRDAHDPWRLANVAQDVHWHVVDLSDLEATTRVVRDVNPRWIFHLAANGAYSSQQDLREMITTNVLGTANLIEAGLDAGFDTFIHTGSSSEYGFKDVPPTEDDRLDPNSHYAVTKATATLLCRQAARAHEAPIATLRLYSAYGAWEEPTRLIPTLALSARVGRLPPLVDPSIARDFVHVDDVVDAILVAAEGAGDVGGEILNVGTGTQTTIADLVDVVRRTYALDIEPEWGSFPNRAWDTGRWQSDPRRIRSLLGWAPKYTVAEGFAEFAAWLESAEGSPYLERSAGRFAR